MLGRYVGTSPLGEHLACVRWVLSQLRGLYPYKSEVPAPVLLYSHAVSHGRVAFSEGEALLCLHFHIKHSRVVRRCELVYVLFSFARVSVPAADTRRAD